ncbi:Aerotolerance protein BatA [hydrothermal vent metagenome]|uniref:Aerotolerance protein BatA n=1 Tax=hydrothermal vent metagenome TaxID=652676 RepID=A0A3B1BZA5_9ZZZZ
MRFADPWFLLLLLFLPIWLVRYLKARRRSCATFSSTWLIRRLSSYRRPAFIDHAPFVLRFTAIVLIVLALARPQTGYREENITSRGIDIMLTLDLSSSMTATDLKPTRLVAAKRVIGKFIDNRKNDRIGLVVFAAQGYTQCPLTLDYPILKNFLGTADIGVIEDGTAIGMALATAANRLNDSEAKSRIVVLLTDGVNNRGAIDPVTAAEMAKAIGVKVYTIGVGREGVFYQTVKRPDGTERQVRARTEIDEKLLKQVAQVTGGQYFRAQDEQTLSRIYEEIDRLEKTDVKIKVYVRHTDWFMWLLIPALLIVLGELLLPVTRFRALP